MSFLSFLSARFDVASFGFNRKDVMILVTGCGIPDTGVIFTLGLVVIVCSIGSDLSLGSSSG